MASQVRTITGVETQKRRATRRSIYIDGEFAFGVSEEAYVRFALFVGREVTEEFLKEVETWETLYQARQTALRYVNARMRSEKEIRTKLRDKEFEEDTIEKTIAFLNEYGMLDDEAFARSYVNDRLLKKQYGRRRLEGDLQTKGIDRETMKRVLDERFGDDEEFESAMQAARKKLPKIRHDDPYKRRASLSAFLANRGFGWEVIRRVIERIEET